MSTWNYQIGFKRYKYKDSTALEEQEELQYGIVEVYRNDKGEIQAVSEEFQTPFGETYDELINDLYMMLKDAQDRPVLDLDNQETIGFEIEGIYNKEVNE